MLAEIGTVSAEDSFEVSRAVTRLENLAGPDVVAFALERGDKRVTLGYAAAPWMVDTYRWAVNLEQPYKSRVIGLLHGYSATAIETFETRAAVVLKPPSRASS